MVECVAFTLVSAVFLCTFCSVKTLYLDFSSGIDKVLSHILLSKDQNTRNVYRGSSLTVRVLRHRTRTQWCYVIYCKHFADQLSKFQSMHTFLHHSEWLWESQECQVCMCECVCVRVRVCLDDSCLPCRDLSVFEVFRHLGHETLEWVRIILSLIVVIKAQF